MRPILTALAVLTACTFLTACGDAGETIGDANRPAPPASDFPAPEGRTLAQLMDSATGEGPIVSPAGQVLRKGSNRMGYGVFTPGREQIDDAEIALYAAPGNIDGKAIGPFPLRIDDLSTESAFAAETTVNDPDAAQVVYVGEFNLPSEGQWSFGALTRDGDGYTSSLVPAPAKAGQFDPPAAGDPAPRISTFTAADVTDISEIDTRIPPGTMHDVNFADAIGKKPIVLLFATPALCQSRVCGPVVDVAEQVKRDEGDGVAFIHQEIFIDNKPPAVRGQVTEYNLPSEPWLFVIDDKGIIRTAIEGAFGIDELTEAVREVKG